MMYTDGKTFIVIVPTDRTDNDVSLVFLMGRVFGVCTLYIVTATAMILLG